MGRKRRDKGEVGTRKEKGEKIRERKRRLRGKKGRKLKILSSLEDLMTIDATVVNTNQTETSLGNTNKRKVKYVFRIQALTADMGIRDVRDLSIPKLVRGIFL